MANDKPQTRSKSTAHQETPLYTLEQVQDLVKKAVAASTEKILEAHNEKISALQRTISALEERVKKQELKHNHLEQYSRRSHLRIRGLEVTQGADCKKVVADFVCSKLRSGGEPVIHITSEDIDAAHPLPVRHPTPYTDADTTSKKTPRTPRSMVIVRFHKRDTRDQIIRARRLLKSSPFSVQEDLTAQNYNLLRQLNNSKEVDTAWSWEGKIYARLIGESKARRFDIYDPVPQ